MTSLLTECKNNQMTVEVAWDMLHKFWKDVEKELRVDQHQQLASDVSHLARYKPTNYEITRPIMDRYTLAMTTHNLDNLVASVLDNFWPQTRENPENSVKRTMLIFIRDWIVESNLQSLVIWQHRTDELLPLAQVVVGMTQRQQDRELWLIMYRLHSDIKQLPYFDYVKQMVKKWTPLWTSMSTKEFYQTCAALWVLIIHNRQKYYWLLNKEEDEWQEHNRALCARYKITYVPQQ